MFGKLLKSQTWPTNVFFWKFGVLRMWRFFHKKKCCVIKSVRADAPLSVVSLRNIEQKFRKDTQALFQNEAEEICDFLRLQIIILRWALNASTRTVGEKLVFFYLLVWWFCFWPYEIQSNTTVCLVFCKSLKPSSQSLQVKTTGSVTTLLNWLWMLRRRNFTKRQKGRQACQPLVLKLGTNVIYHLLLRVVDDYRPVLLSSE